MAALVDGQRYGLSSHGYNNENKTLIFVKLTDSALRTIEEYLILRGTIPRHPTIQFQGNQGVLTLPSSPSADGEHSFDFNFSPSSETEGIQGSFECVQKCSSRSLQSLGFMQYKMHIHAKDDIYQTTRTRISAAEEESKKNCTKVIKAAGPYVGRKVKVKKITPIPAKPPPTSPTHIPALPKREPVLNLPASKLSTSGHTNGSHHSSNSSNTNIQVKQPSSSAKPVNAPGNPDIMRRAYRERIIHLLALRPYKKPELLARLMKDGIKEKDKKTLTTMLLQVAYLKDNVYQLARHVWSEVQDDWPFYTEFDKQLLKRRKPQNLTPSDEVELSPPSGMNDSSPNSGQKRLNNDSELIPTKKQRISHYSRQPDVATGQFPTDCMQMAPKSDPNGYYNGLHTTDVNEVNSDSHSVKYNCNPSLPVKESYGTEGFHGNNSQHYLHAKTDSNGAHLGKTDSIGFVSSSNSEFAREIKTDSKYSSTLSNNINSCPPGRVTNGYGRCVGKLSTSLSSALCNGSTGGSRHSSPSSSPDSHDAMDSRGPDSQQSIGSSSPSSLLEFPNHLKKYTVIKNPDQRSQYKADFNADYVVYRELHAIIDRVAKRFSLLEERLRNSDEGSEDSKKIQDQIVREYKENKRDHQYQDAKRKFNYLHQKLSHIKKLVLDYDSAHVYNS